MRIPGLYKNNETGWGGGCGGGGVWGGVWVGLVVFFLGVIGLLVGLKRMKNRNTRTAPHPHRSSKPREILKLAHSITLVLEFCVT